MPVTMILTKGDIQHQYLISDSMESIEQRVDNVVMGYENSYRFKYPIRILPKYVTINNERIKEYIVDLLVVTPSNYDSIEFIHHDETQQPELLNEHDEEETSNVRKV